MTREQLCALRDQFIMDSNYSNEQHEFMFEMTQNQILALG